MTNTGGALIPFWRQTRGSPSNSVSCPTSSLDFNPNTQSVPSTSSGDSNPDSDPDNLYGSPSPTPLHRQRSKPKQSQKSKRPKHLRQSKRSKQLQQPKPAHRPRRCARSHPSPLRRRLALPPRQRPSQRRVRERPPLPGPRGQRAAQRARTRRGAGWGAANWRGCSKDDNAAAVGVSGGEAEAEEGGSGTRPRLPSCHSRSCSRRRTLRAGSRVM